MSHTLFTADNISVKGYHYTINTVESLKDSVYTSLPEKKSYQSGPKLYDGVGSGLEKHKDEIIQEDCIHLDFTLLINGKLKTFGWSFIIIKSEDSEIYEFEDWTTWNAIYFTLKNLGYKIEDSEYLFGQEQAIQWIQQIMKHI